MQGTFGFGALIKKVFKKNNKKSLLISQKKNKFKTPLYLDIENEKNSLLLDENQTISKINVLKNDILKLKEDINKIKILKKKLMITSLKIKLREINSKLDVIEKRKKSTDLDNKNINLNIDNLNIKKKDLLKEINKKTKDNEALDIKIIDKLDLIKSKESEIKILNEDIKSIKLKINDIEVKLSNLIENEDFKNSKIRKRNTFLGLFLPILIFGIYFYGIGRERYRVSSNVVVRKSGSSAEAGGGFISLLGLGNQGSLEDARFLKIYLQSPQILEDLFLSLDFKKRYAYISPDIFAGLKKDDSREEIYNFFRKQVVIILDEISGSINIVTLAFDPNTALEFNKFLVTKSEEFVNKLNQNIYLRQVGFVDEQVSKNRTRLLKDMDKLKNFQRNNLSLNLNQELIASSSIISSLENKLIELKLKLSVLKRKFIDPSAPEISDLETQIEELKKQIQEERNLLVSPLGKNIGEKASELSRLEANFEFSNNLLKSSLAASEKTKLDSKQQQRFMATLSQPYLPEDEWYYWRHKGFLTSLATILVSYFLIKFFMGIADSHNN